MKGLLLALAFLLELAMLVAAGWWGFTLDAGWPVRLLAGLGAPLLIAVVWGTFCSPKAAVPLPAPGKLAVQAACFVTGGALLALAGRPVPAILLVALWAVDKALLSLAGDPICPTPRPSPVRRGRAAADAAGARPWPDRPNGRTLRR